MSEPIPAIERLRRNLAARPGERNFLMADIKEVADEVERLRAAIVKHHAQRADDRCWLDDADLYLAAGLEAAQHVFEVGDREKMLKNCERFVEQRCVEGGGWKSYAELLAENTRLQSLNESLGAEMHEAVEHAKMGWARAAMWEERCARLGAGAAALREALGQAAERQGQEKQATIRPPWDGGEQ